MDLTPLTPHVLFETTVILPVATPGEIKTEIDVLVVVIGDDPSVLVTPKGKVQV